MAGHKARNLILGVTSKVKIGHTSTGLDRRPVEFAHPRVLLHVVETIRKGALAHGSVTFEEGSDQRPCAVGQANQIDFCAEDLLFQGGARGPLLEWWTARDHLYREYAERPQLRARTWTT